jgi:hypothetical protein
MSGKGPLKGWEKITQHLLAAGVGNAEACALINELRADTLDEIYRDLWKKRENDNPHMWVRFLMNVAWDRGIVTALSLVARRSDRMRAVARTMRNPRKVQPRA